jgi:hypothetical protein
VLWGAEVAKSRVRLSGNTFQQRCRQSRLADTCLAGEQHYLAFTALRLRPAPYQQFGLFFSSDEVSKAARVESLEAALRRTRPQRCPGSNRRRNAFEFLRPKVFKLEQIAEQFSGAFANDDHVRLSNAL